MSDPDEVDFVAAVSMHPLWCKSFQHLPLEGVQLQCHLLILQVYPDMGVAAMLKNQWPDVSFNFASLSDRKPVSDDDDLIVLAAPDPQSMCHG